MNRRSLMKSGVAGLSGLWLPLKNLEASSSRAPWRCREAEKRRSSHSVVKRNLPSTGIL